MKKGMWTKDYIFAVFVLLCVHTGPYLLLSVITVYGKLLSGSDTMAGMMASVFALSGLFARFLSAWLLDKFPLKKVLIGFSAVMAAASFIYIFSNSFMSAFILRGIQGLAYGVTCTAMSTYIVQLLDPEYRLEGIGYSSLTANLANAVGPTAAYALLGENVDQFQALFTAVFISTVLSLVLMFFVRDKKEEVSKEQESNEKGGFGLIVIPFVIWMSMSFAMSSVAAFLSLSALEKGFSGIGLFFTFNVIGLVISRFVMKRLMDRFGENTMIMAMIIIIAASLAGIGLASRVWQLYVIALPFGFANGCLAPIINTKMINSLPDSRSGFANAVFFAAGDAGFIIGPTALGMIAQAAGYTFAFIFSAAICVLMAAFQLLTGRRVQHENI
ncbi:MAG: MFS transporter [Faecalicoccus sp.]|nr:MFS transporter [Faecalicoccus sp.]